MVDRLLRPNYRRARVLALELEAAREHLADLYQDPDVGSDEIEELKAEIYYLQHELFLTGVTSEYEL